MKFIYAILVKIPSSMRGFTLIELMIVVAIISILATLALPKFERFQARSKHTEAHVNLASIYTLQESYFATNSNYANFAGVGYGHTTPSGAMPTASNCNNNNELGFTVTNCLKVNYHYNTGGSTLDFLGHALSGGGSEGFAGPNRVFPGCDIPDIWTVDHDKKMLNIAGEDFDFSVAELDIDHCL